MSYFRSKTKEWELFPGIELKCLVKPSTLGQWIDVMSFDYGDSAIRHIFFQTTENITSLPLNNINLEMRLVDENLQEMARLTTAPLAGSVNLIHLNPNPINSNLSLYVPRDSRLQFKFVNEVPKSGKIWLLLVYETASIDFVMRLL